MFEVLSAKDGSLVKPVYSHSLAMLRTLIFLFSFLAPKGMADTPRLIIEPAERLAFALLLTAQQQNWSQNDLMAVNEKADQSSQRVNVHFTGKPAPPPTSPHPNIEMFKLPSGLTESVGGYLEKNLLHQLSTNQKVAVALTLNKCSKLAQLPQILQRMGLDQVTVQPNAELVVICDGFAEEMIPQVISVLAESARDGDIPAILSLLYLLDPGNDGVRYQLEIQEGTTEIPAQDLYHEVHRLASASIPEGNLYYARSVTTRLLHHGTHGIPQLQPDGCLRSSPHRPSLIKAAAYFDALYAVTGDRLMPSRSTSTQQQLSEKERGEARELADELVASWMRKPVLYDSEIKAQGYWTPDME